MKAIETLYDGHRFRSRLEARWAVFFNTLFIPYEYEKEGYDLGKAGWYLPDFWLPTLHRWIEIKWQIPTPEDVAKIDALYETTGYPACLLFGEPWRNTGNAHWYCMH